MARLTMNKYSKLRDHMNMERTEYTGMSTREIAKRAESQLGFEVTPYHVRYIKKSFAPEFDWIKTKQQALKFHPSNDNDAVLAKAIVHIIGILQCHDDLPSSITRELLKITGER